MRARREANAIEPVAVRIPQAAVMLGIGRSTLCLGIAAGEIDTIKVGRATLVPVESLFAFVASRGDRRHEADKSTSSMASGPHEPQRSLRNAFNVLNCS